MKVLCTSTKIGTKLQGRWAFHGRLFGVLQSMILRGNVKNKIIALIFADVVNTYKDTSRKTKFFLTHAV